MEAPDAGIYESCGSSNPTKPNRQTDFAITNARYKKCNLFCKPISSQLTCGAWTNNLNVSPILCVLMMIILCPLGSTISNQRSCESYYLMISYFTRRFVLTEYNCDTRCLALSDDNWQPKTPTPRESEGTRKWVQKTPSTPPRLQNRSGEFARRNYCTCFSNHEHITFFQGGERVGTPGEAVATQPEAAKAYHLPAEDIGQGSTSQQLTWH